MQFNLFNAMSLLQIWYVCKYVKQLIIKIRRDNISQDGLLGANGRTGQ
jgi:hypothetical protein